MGGGNINKKKSWDPTRRPNQEKVWKAERQALEERNRIEEKKKEIAESRRVEELQRLQNMAQGTPDTLKVDWMYASAATDAVKISPEREYYLLGNRKSSKVGSCKVSGKKERGHSKREMPVKDRPSSISHVHLLEIQKRELKRPKTRELVPEHKTRDAGRRGQRDTIEKHQKKRKREDEDGKEHFGSASCYDNEGKRYRSVRKY